MICTNQFFTDVDYHRKPETHFYLTQQKTHEFGEELRLTAEKLMGSPVR